jgi:ABC transporter
VVASSFQLNSGDKVGLVGPNGAGKTTLFRLIVGEETADEGEVSVPRKLSIGYFRQDAEEMAGRSVLDEAIAGSGELGDLHHELEALQQAMGDPARADEMDATEEGGCGALPRGAGGQVLSGYTDDVLVHLGPRHLLPAETLQHGGSGEQGARGPGHARGGPGVVTSAHSPTVRR